MAELKEPKKVTQLSRSKFLYHNDYQLLEDEISLNVKEKEGIIKNVHVVTEGVAKGHDVWLNKKFIEDVVTQGKSASMGMKVRYGHPNMSSTALGTYLGRLHNFRLRRVENENYDPEDKESTKTKNIAIADLYLDESARKAPQSSAENNPYDYVIELAKTNPDMFGLSIVFKNNGFEEKMKRTKDDRGEEIAYPQIKLRTLYGADAVDEPAANKKLFHSGTFAEQATMFLDENPEIFDLIHDNPNLFEEFMQRYQKYKLLKNSEMPKAKEHDVEKTKTEKTELEKGKVEETKVEETKVEETKPDADTEKVEEKSTDEKSFSDKVFEKLGELKNLFGKKEEKSEEATEPTADQIQEFNDSKENISKRIDEIETSLKAKDDEINALKAIIQEKETEIEKYQKSEKKQVVEEKEIKKSDDTTELETELDPETESLRSDLKRMKNSLGKSS